MKRRDHTGEFGIHIIIIIIIIIIILYLRVIRGEGVN
jgi:hypothetical protein